jgi:sterol 22-desaturase
MAAVQNTSFHSPLAQASYHKLGENGAVEGVLSTISGLSGWSIALTLLLGAVLYDQGKLPRSLKQAESFSGRGLTYLAVSYQLQKGSIVGPTFKTPFIGPFLQSVNPKFSEYAAKWASGDLSCVSVFHK